MGPLPSSSGAVQLNLTEDVVVFVTLRLVGADNLSGIRATTVIGRDKSSRLSGSTATT